jgi:Pentapeptide repeats (8 copies)
VTRTAPQRRWWSFVRWSLLLGAAGLYVIVRYTDWGRSNWARRGSAALAQAREVLPELPDVRPLRAVVVPFLVAVFVGLLTGSRGRRAARAARPSLPRWFAMGLAAVAIIALLVVVVVFLPPRFTANRTFRNTSEQLKAENDVRTSMLQGLAGAVLVVGAYYTSRQLRTDRERQITDRFTHAVDQLGNKDGQMEVVIGGIYALARIAHDSPGDRIAIAEVLTAYIRVHAPWPPSTDGDQRRLQKVKSVSALHGRAPGVQAALNVLSRGNFAGVTQLDLSSADLRKADLRAHNLQGVVLDGTNLAGASLENAHLEGALLYNANLRASLDGAHFEGAYANRWTLWPEGMGQTPTTNHGADYEPSDAPRKRSEEEHAIPSDFEPWTD